MKHKSGRDIKKVCFGVDQYSDCSPTRKQGSVYAKIADGIARIAQAIMKKVSACGSV